MSGSAFTDPPGVVVSDDQSEPDGDGISHCRTVACLTSGEYVAIRMTT